MARLFGALANAAAKYGEGRFKRQAYDDQQAQIDLENKRRAFEFAAMQGLQRDQMDLNKRLREDALQRQRELDVVSAQQKGYETAAPEAFGAAANAFLQSQGMGGPATSGVVRAPNTAPKQYTVEDQTFGDASQPGRQMQYATVGGRLMRYDPQRDVNDATRQAFEKYSQDLKFKRDIAQENQRARDEAAKERADEANRTRVLIAQIAASARQNGDKAGVQRPTEAQEKSYLYSKLMSQGNAIMQAEEANIDPNRISAYLSAKWSKPSLTPAEQRYLVGARTYAAGVYRKESGAAIKDEEIAETFRRYIPGILDDPSTRELKRQQREEYEQTMNQLALPAARYYDQYGTPTSVTGGDQANETPAQRLARMRGQK